MKTITLTKTLLIVFLGITSLILTSCEEFSNCITPMGRLAEETRFPARSFTAIDLRISANVVVVQDGDIHSIFLKASPNILDNIITRLEGNTLVIERERCMQLSSHDITIIVTQEKLSGLIISGSGSIKIDHVFENNKMTMKIGGSGSIRGEVNGGELLQIISGSGDIDLKGVFDYQNINISGSGNVLNRFLQCHEAEVTINGSGNAFVFATHKLRATINGSGNVFYFGNPLHISTWISGSGKVMPS